MAFLVSTTANFGSVDQGIKPNIIAISTSMLPVSIAFVTLGHLINCKGRHCRSGPANPANTASPCPGDQMVQVIGDESIPVSYTHLTLPTSDLV